MERITLKDDRMRIIGYIDVYPNGDKTLRDFSMKILGYYDASQNVTRTFNQRIVARCDVLTSLLNNN